MNDTTIEYRRQQFQVGLVQEAKYFQSNVTGNHYAPVYDSRAFDYLAYRARKRGKLAYDNRILITGPVRTGKSTIAATWARAIDPDFPIENVAFRLADFLKVMNDLPAASPTNDVFPVAILDESGVDLYRHDWASIWVKNMAKVFQIVGKKQLTVILNLPHKDMLATNIANQMKFWITTLDDEEEMRGYAEVRLSKYNLWGPPYWNPLFGIMFEQLSDKWWSSYEGFKDEFINAFLAEEATTESIRLKKVREQRDIALQELKKHMTIREIEDLTGVDHARIARLSQPSPILN